MNTARLRALFTRNKVPLAIAGALAVVVIALVARKRSAIDSVDGTGQATGTSGGASTSYGSAAQAGALAPYDSTSSDVYNLIQPQLEELRNLYNSQPVPVPDEPAAKSLGVFAHYKDDGTGGAFYELFDDFTSRIISAGEATVNSITPKDRLNDEQFSAYARANPSDRYRYKATTG